MTHRSLLTAITVVLLAAAYLVATMVPPRDTGDVAIHAFGRLPCVAGGREKPFDTFARNTLMMISDRQTFYDNEGNRQPAIKWLLDVMAGSPAAFEHKVFRIENMEVLSFLGLEPRLETKYKFRYAFSEFGAKEGEIREQASRAMNTPEGDQTVYQRKVLELWAQMQRFIALWQWHEPHVVPPLNEGDEWRPMLAAISDGLKLDRNNPQAFGRLLEMVSTRKDMVLRLAVSGGTEEMPVEVAPTARKLAGIWLAYSQYEALDDMVRNPRGEKSEKEAGTDPATLAKLRDSAAAAFNSEVASYQTQLGMEMPQTISKAGHEVFFNSFSPFYRCMLLYVLSFVLVLVGLLRWGVPLNRAALWLAVLTLAVHTFALIFRMYLTDRWMVFVINLYSSAVFIGWAAALFGLIFEWVYRNGIGTMVASIAGFLTLLIAHNLASDGKDTVEMMQAVLDTNFWLATHVTTVTLGYAATFLAGFLAILYILMGVFTRRVTPDLNKQFGSMIYGTLCFAILFSFTGTVLGGIWADQSWGRFWGWDPKENGALMIVIWNALILHARWGGMVRQRGIAVLAIFGNVVTSWSWFGVNMLGAGLHSYGFMDSALNWLLLFAASQLVLMGIGLLPLQFWRSFAGSRPRDPQPAPGAAPAPV